MYKQFKINRADIRSFRASLHQLAWLPSAADAPSHWKGSVNAQLSRSFIFFTVVVGGQPSQISLQWVVYTMTEKMGQIDSYKGAGSECTKAKLGGLVGAVIRW